MIAVSDIVLIVVSAAVLATGLFRWQNNVEQAALAEFSGATANQAQQQPAVATNSQATRQVGEERQVPDLNGTATSNAVQGNVSQDAGQQQNVNTQVLVTEPQTTAINVADDSATATDNEAVRDLPPYGSYLVRSGDSLSLIARQYGTTVAVLQDINNLQGTLITVGQQLSYPLPVN